MMRLYLHTCGKCGKCGVFCTYVQMRLVTTSFGLFARRRKRAEKEKATYDDRSNRAFPFPAFSILDNGHLPSSLLYQGRFSSARSHLFSRFLLLIVSRYTPVPARPPPRTERCSGIQYLRSFHVWTIPPRSLPHSTLPLANLPVGILSGYCCSPCARNIDPRANYIVLFRVHTLQSIHSTSGRALFDARQLSWSIVSHSFGNVPKPFSFIHSARSVEIFVRTRWQR